MARRKKTSFRSPAFCGACCIAFVAFWLSLAEAQEQPSAGATSLRWRLAAGDEFNVTFTQSSETITTVGKNAVRMRVELGTELGWRIDRVDDSENMHIEQIISRLTMKFSKRAGEGTETIDYDSASPERPSGAARDVANSAGPLVGLKVLMTISPRGEILEVQLPDDTREAIEKIQNRSKAASLFTPDGISEVLKQAMPLLPSKAVKPGDQWEVTSEKLLSSGKLQQTTTLTYQGPDETMRGLQKIDVTGEVTLDPNQEALTKLKLNEQQLTGTLWFDEMRGHMARGSISQQLVTEAPYRDEQITTHLTTQLDFQFEPQN